MSMNVQLLGFAIAFVLAGPAAAKDVTVGTTTLHLPPPAGYCELDERNDADAEVLKVMGAAGQKTNNRILVVSADCEVLAEWRAGKRPTLNKLSHYQTSVSEENQPLKGGTPEAVIRALCNEMRSRAQQIIDQSSRIKDVKSRVEKLMGDLKINEMKFLGVLDEEPLVCYAASLLKLQTESGSITQVTTLASTVLNQKLIYSYLIAEHENEDTTSNMLTLHRQNIEQLRRVNP
jgi:hypothetical protein